MQVSVPGSLMWFGEHAVLHGNTGIVSAINRRMTIKLLPRKDHLIIINSNNYGEYQTSINDFNVSNKFNFILESITPFLPKLKNGFTLNIDSKIHDNVGFGSSAAVVVGTTAILYWWLNHHQPAKYRLWKKCLNVIKQVQGCGSGGDLAASIYGGFIKYRKNYLKCIKLSFPFSAIYCGYKKSTKEVIKLVEQIPIKRRYPIYRIMNKISQSSWRFLEKQSLNSVGNLMNKNRFLQQQLGVEDQILNTILNFLATEPEILGAKISGSGLGDCVLALGKLTNNINIPNTKVFNLNIDRGIIYVEK